jgi:hypothetical protein
VVSLQTSLKTKSEPKPERDVSALAGDRVARGRILAARMWQAGQASGSVRAMRRAWLVERCSDDENVWMCRSMKDADEREFDAFGVKSSCASRLCPHCIKTIQRKAEKRLVTARNEFWRTHSGDKNKRERFVTLTSPILQGVSQYDADKIFNRAFELLSERAFWKDRVDAGAKHLEFTIRERGTHTHIHSLTYGTFMDGNKDKEDKTREWRKQRRQEQAAKLAARGLRIIKNKLPTLGNLQDEWTECITTAAWDTKINSLEVNRVIEWGANYDRELRAHVLGSYCLMSTRELVVPDVKVGWYTRWPLSDGEAVEMQPTDAFKAIVDIREVREKGRPGRGEIGLTDAIKELCKYVTKASSWDAVADDELVALAEVKRWPRCFELFGAWKPRRKKSMSEVVEASEAQPEATQPLVEIKPGEGWEVFCSRVRKENGSQESFSIAWKILIAAGDLYSRTRSVIALLDTDSLSPVEVEEECLCQATESPPRDRAPSLMSLDEAIPFTAWLKVVDLRLSKARQTRTRLLSRQYSYVDRFWCLDGSEFYGQRELDERRLARMDASVLTMHGAY